MVRSGGDLCTGKTFFHAILLCRSTFGFSMPSWMHVVHDEDGLPGWCFSSESHSMVLFRINNDALPPHSKYIYI